ncbi:hypothetical protein M5689_003914 [Euphorbia peplus]|nr:hypothetical protein M5689_003914 [Euphorbia peplus]
MGNGMLTRGRSRSEEGAMTFTSKSASQSRQGIVWKVKRGREYVVVKRMESGVHVQVSLSRILLEEGTDKSEM